MKSYRNSQGRVRYSSGHIFGGAMTWDMGMPEAVEKRELMMAWAEN